jgi:hypothetical protein
MKSTELLRHLTTKMDAVSETELATVLGLPRHQLRHWRKDTTVLSPLQVANAIANAHKTAKSHAHSTAVKALVEFYPINRTVVGRNGTSLQVFPTGPDAGRHLTGLCQVLSEAKAGLYIFYDSRGKALYAGQTKKQNIWREMNLAFNRERSAQVMTLVRHPTNDVNFKAAHVKVRQPTSRTLKLHDLAAYFSAFEVVPEMVDDFEALLIRAFPNDMLNYKMEKLGKAAKKAAKTRKERAAE